ncbi:hypothetical protein BG003_001926 [Podila horticola]|nr:hypothetical protein BG003_001926 [Podila horticola]
MKGKDAVLVLAQQQQDSQQQQQQQQPYLYNDDNFSYPHNTRMTTYHARPHVQPHHQQNQSRHQKRNSYHGNAGQKHQYLQQQFYQQQYHDYYYNQYSHYDQDMYHYNNSNNGTSYSNGHGYNRFSCNGNSSSDHLQRSFTSCASAKVEATTSLVATSAASTPTRALAPSKSTSVTHAPLPELVVSTEISLSSHKAHSPSMSSSSKSSLHTPIVSEDKAKDTQSSLPEPSEMDSTQLTQNTQDQSSIRAEKGDAAQRLQPAAELDLRLRPPAVDSDISCSSSLRESSDCEDDDKGLLGSDSNDTDSILEEDPLALDRRSRRTRSMQRLVAKNKTLKSSLTQAKADLASERHNRAVIDQIYLKIKKELNAKLEAEELKNANLRAELEQMTMDMQELREKSQSSSYKIGYDSSPYSLTNGLSGIGGLMLHHSSIIDDQDDDDVDDSPAIRDVPERRIASDFLGGDKNISAEQDDDEDSACYLHDESFGFGKTGTGLDEVETEEETDEVSKDSKPVDRKVTFATPDSNSTPTPPPTASVGESALPYDDSHDDDEDEDDEAPCTMMEILMKKQRSQSPEDQVQDPPADVNETFDSMAHKFLHQALHAKFTPARTILQLDDLLLKYDAVSEDLVFVLAQEFMKWWETERIEAGGPVSGGWGTGSVLMPDTGDRVSAKIAVETKFKAIYVPLLLNYVASHREQMLLLEKLENNARTSDKLVRNHVNQLMALYKFDVLDADAILEWWKLLKEPQTVFGHGDGIRSMSSKFVAWLEDEEESDEEDSDSDSDSNDDSDDDGEEDSDDEEPTADFDAVEGSGQGKILGLDLLQEELLNSPRNSLQFLDEDLARKDELMVIDSDDGIDDASTTSSLERIEECERKRRISFCTNNVYIHQNGHVKVKKAPEVDEHGKNLVQCPPMEEKDENEEEDNEDDDNDDDDDE